jgi:GMP synthase-like glutamine amidotransferase
MNLNAKKISIAVLDLYEGHANQGMRCIRDIVKNWGEQHEVQIVLKEFDVRSKMEIPDTSFDIYISSGGPGSPLESEGVEWDDLYFKWLASIEKWNSDEVNEPKHVFFICHSFQLACRHYKIANVCKRNSTAFGVFPIHKLEYGNDESVFDGLREPFYAVDSRDYQVIEPNYKRLDEIGMKVLAIEKERRHVPYERAIMAIRFNEYFIGTQFHPEADAAGMSMYLQREDKKTNVIAEHGEEKWASMLEQLQDPDKILSTYSHILPNFLNIAAGIFMTA